jgi:transposase-like protein
MLKMGGKMEAIENTAINTIQSMRGVFVPVDVLAAFNADFLDEKWCKAWVMERLHGDQPWMGYDPPFCPGCHLPVSDRMMQSFWECKRIRCGGCEKYFTALTGTFLSGCHFTFQQIVLLALLLALGIADKQIASTLNISSENVRLWRHRFDAIARAKTMTEGI